MKHFSTFSFKLILLLISTNTLAQKTYISLYGGYGFPMASEEITTTDGSSPSDDKIVKGTFGQGMNFGLHLGYNVTNQIGLEVGASYFKSSTIKAHDEHNSGGYYMDDNELSSSMIRITPAIRLETTHKQMNAYAKIGFVIGINGFYKDVYTGETDNNAMMSFERINATNEFKGGVSSGFSGSLGFLYNAGKAISIFIETNGIAQSWAPTEAECTEYKRNGTDILSSLSVSERKVEFVDEVKENATPSKNEPTKVLKNYLPMSGIFINAGIQFRFGNTEKKKTETAPQKN
jgi:hypothetical protein